MSAKERFASWLRDLADRFDPPLKPDKAPVRRTKQKFKPKANRQMERKSRRGNRGNR